MEKSQLQELLDRLDETRIALSNLIHSPMPHRRPATRRMPSRAAHRSFVFRLAIFVLAIFVGYYVVWSVTPALHTPLMAVTNAISSVIVVGALLAVGISVSGLATGFGFIALILASVNIFGGFLVTQRMLAMYKKKDK